MKSQLFKSAWNIVKIKGITFSEALKIAWKAFKNDVKIIVCESWKKVKSIVFSKNGTTSEDILKAIKAVRTSASNELSQAWYGCGRYNGD